MSIEINMPHFSSKSAKRLRQQNVLLILLLQFASEQHDFLENPPGGRKI